MYVIGTNKGNFYAITEEGNILAKFNGSHHWVETNPKDARYRVSCYFDQFNNSDECNSQTPQIGYKRLTENRMTKKSKVSNGVIVLVSEVESLEEALAKITELQRHVRRFPSSRP